MVNDFASFHRLIIFLLGLINATGPVEVVGLDQIPVDETQNGEKTANGTAIIDEPSKNLISGQVIQKHFFYNLTNFFD